MMHYKGNKFTISFNEGTCKHAGVCVAKLPKVFDVKRDSWIDPNQEDNIEALKATIKACPSGALAIKEN